MNLIGIFLFSIVTLTESYKFLVVTQLPVRSLNILGEGVSRSLIEAGHEVTFITVFPLKNPPKKNFRQIDVSSVMKIFEADSTVLNIGYLMENEPPLNDISYLHDFTVRSAIETFDNEHVKALLEDTNEKFDAIIVDFCETDLLAAYSVVYDAPLIIMYSMGAHSQVLRLIDKPTNPAYTSDHLSSNVPPFNFRQRVEELWAQIKWRWIKTFTTEKIEEAVYKKYFEPLLAKRGRMLPDFHDMMYNVSLVLGNEHHAIGNIPSTPQNFKFVGGYHIETPVKALPKNLQELMDNAKNGVIYFSMGSTWQSKDIPKVMIENLLKMFGELKETVIWKFEEELPNVPHNVHIIKWAPQPSILANPNLKFFITHGGLLSSTEAIHFGVPVIGIPIYFDQFVNVNKAVAAGYSLKVRLDFNMHKNLREAIIKMLSDSSYAKRAKELSALFHDRMMPPRKELVFWAEYVVRTKGAPHLRSPALFVPFYQRMYLDLLALIFIMFLLVVVLLKKLLRKITKRNHKKTD
ncbi:hypothetical protein K1T71_012103 [Dendrolimus kikuchii]|uniref:Uncharacterized protein n=1 Tax=Dendrolimus kikuchii TaxID=765133 RepID=A0ACC1CKK3_9NEOP|nr:hypothetical protein K1T71_012103 [Dendrolimus kikuchii]